MPVLPVATVGPILTMGQAAGLSNYRQRPQVGRDFFDSECKDIWSKASWVLVSHLELRENLGMGLSINNNVSSLTAQHNLNRTSSMLSKSLERLSSGLKINRGADGPAALVISEQQRAQIAGLNAAIDNTSKAFAMVQTTEGALNEINSLLVKIRSLALDSANTGVNDATALAANQAEVANALATIDRIANTTQFGSKKVLDGTLAPATVTRTDDANANIESRITTGLANVDLADGDYKLKITTAFVPAVPAVAASSVSGLTSADAATFFDDTSGAGGTDVAADTVVNGSFFTDSGNLVVGGKFYTYTETDTVNDVLTTINADATNRFNVNLSDSTHLFTVAAKTRRHRQRHAGPLPRRHQMRNAGRHFAGVNAVMRVDAAGEIIDNTGTR